MTSCLTSASSSFLFSKIWITAVTNIEVRDTYPCLVQGRTGVYEVAAIIITIVCPGQFGVSSQVSQMPDSGVWIAVREAKYGSGERRPSKAKILIPGYRLGS